MSASFVAPSFLPVASPGSPRPYLGGFHHGAAPSHTATCLRFPLPAPRSHVPTPPPLGLRSCFHDPVQCNGSWEVLLHVMDRLIRMPVELPEELGGWEKKMAQLEVSKGEESSDQLLGWSQRLEGAPG